MEHDYKRACNAVRLSDTRRAEIRAALSARCNTLQEEDSHMNKQKFSRIFAIALAAALALTAVGFAYGAQIIEMLGGGQIEIGETVDGGYIAIDSGAAVDPVEVRDGRIYFILDGQDADITDHCSSDTYFQYEKITGDGTRHVFVVGGTPDALGWAEFIWPSNGSKASSAQFPSADEPAWYAAAVAEIGF